MKNTQKNNPSSGEKRKRISKRHPATDGDPSSAEQKPIRLNRYLASAGIASRRKADELITAGQVSVNGQVMTELGYKVNPGDEVRYNKQLVKPERHVYILLNKPKDYLTTTSDPRERKTVLDLVRHTGPERIYPVGRLDRNTTGLLLLTNDGDLAETLAHPSGEVTKVYYATLNKALKQKDMQAIIEGLTLDDGLITVDDITYAEGGSKKEIGIQIHSGRNRIIHRIFEHLGYRVTKLDRVLYANLTKKNLPRGKWRFLSEQEVINLKHLRR